jgi:uncharacterized repeat protein (TIGR03847 family)
VSESFEFTEPDHVTAGAIGPPGERVFYLQARQGGQVVNLRLEKQQVAALCEYLGGILNDLAAVTEPLPTDVDLLEPVIAEWVVGALAVAYEEADDRILLVAEEFVPSEEGDDEESVVVDEPSAMVAHASRVVTAGRPICPICGRPMEPEGHFCPRNN